MLLVTFNYFIEIIITISRVALLLTTVNFALPITSRILVVISRRSCRSHNMSKTYTEVLDTIATKYHLYIIALPCL